MSSRRAAPDIAYVYAGGIYLNLTNRCPTACRFCAKFAWDWSYRGIWLRLQKEPSVAELLAAARQKLSLARRRELVFCGYGEPTERLGALLAVARALRREQAGLRLRLNTVGLGSLTNKRDIVPELARVLDSVSVSLNTADPAQWRSLHRPRAALAAAGFDAVCGFIRGCAAAGLETTVTAVDQQGVDLASVRRLALSLGARFRLRPPL